VRRYDLIVLGAGSGNMLFGPELAHLKAAVVEPGRFGGTCLNRGCIPSKMFVVAADLARSVHEAERLGVHAHLDRVDWPGIRDRVFGRIDPIHDSAVEYRRANGIDVYTDPAHFTAPGVLDVGGEQLTADRIVVSVGSRPMGLPWAWRWRSAAGPAMSWSEPSIPVIPGRSIRPSGLSCAWHRSSVLASPSMPTGATSAACWNVPGYANSSARGRNKPCARRNCSPCRRVWSRNCCSTR